MKNNKRKIFLTILIFSFLALSPIIAKANNQINLDQYGNLIGFFEINVTNAPTQITIKVPGNVTGYEAIDLNNNDPLPISYSNGLLTILVTNSSLVNISFISLNAAIQNGNLFSINLELPVESNISFPNNAVLIYTNSTIVSSKNNTLTVLPGNVTFKYSIANQTTTSITSTTTVISSITTTSTSISATSSLTTTSTKSSTTTSKLSYPSYYIAIGIIVVILIIIIAFLIIRKKT
ncbi:MAG: hypothetical protein ACP5I6_06055 [Caldisphaera sp.]|jgi:hypothetical protein|nr:hypothetical protein [Caldisphaera sp.]PMP88110.1 MAG: hypothetical protein C0172_03315 [Caldisphaera sp.]